MYELIHERMFVSLCWSTALQVKIYKLDSPFDPSLRPIPLTSSLGPCKKFLYSKLPQRYWKQYEYTSRFVNLLRSETAKIVLYSDRGKAMLMENTPNPNFVVCFYDGKSLVQQLHSVLWLSRGNWLLLKCCREWTYILPYLCLPYNFLSINQSINVSTNLLVN